VLRVLQAGDEVVGTNCQTAVVQTPGANPIIPIGGTTETPGTTEPDATPAEEPAEPTIINWSAGPGAASTAPAAGGGDATPGASKPIETTQTGPYVPGRK